MRPAYEVPRIRAAEAAAAAGLPAGTLMNRAATGLAVVCLDLLPRAYGARVALLVGSGDNGGDALFAGARLAARGAGVTALLLDPGRTHAAGLTEFRRCGGRVGADAGVLDTAELVLDGIVGIGGVGGLRPAAAELVERAAAGPGRIVAVDLPSGVDAATGEVPAVAVRAEVTVTFGTLKPGLLIDPGAGHAGVITCVDIGIDAGLGAPSAISLQSADLVDLLPRPGRESDKYRRGVVGVLAGSRDYPGAAVLAVAGALRAGAGMVRFVGTPSVATHVLAAWPEVVAGAQHPRDAGQVQAWVAGPGLGGDPVVLAAVGELLAGNLPVLLDADALPAIARFAPASRVAPTLLTPHAGELARLLDVSRAEVEAARLTHARAAADRFGAHVLLKGATTIVVGPGSQPVYCNATGTAWAGTAGSGDVLSGLAGALLAAGLAPGLAGAAAAHLHGLAARQAYDGAGPGGAPITAGDIAAHIPPAWSCAGNQ